MNRHAPEAIAQSLFSETGADHLLPLCARLPKRQRRRFRKRRAESHVRLIGLRFVHYDQRNAALYASRKDKLPFLPFSALSGCRDQFHIFFSS